MKVVLIRVKGDYSANVMCSMKNWREYTNKLVHMCLTSVAVGGKAEENISATDNHVYGHVVVVGEYTRVVLEIDTLDVPRYQIEDLSKEEENNACRFS